MILFINHPTHHLVYVCPDQVHLDSEELRKLQRLFSAIDEDNAGTITPDEFLRALKRTAVPQAEIEKMFRDVDQDHTGHIKYTTPRAAPCAVICSCVL